MIFALILVLIFDLTALFIITQILIEVKMTQVVIQRRIEIKFLRKR